MERIYNNNDSKTKWNHHRTVKRWLIRKKRKRKNKTDIKRIKNSKLLTNSNKKKQKVKNNINKFEHINN